MAQELESPYTIGETLTLRVHRKGQIRLADRDLDEGNDVDFKICEVIKPSTMSVVLVVQLAQEDHGLSSSRTVLKLFDRRFSSELREWHNVGAATSVTEEEYRSFLRRGSMPQFLHEFEDDDYPSDVDWDVARSEAYFYARSSQMHEIEVEVYNRLTPLQGVHVPKYFADVRVVTNQKEEGPTDYTEVKGVLIDFIPGFVLKDFVNVTPEPVWATICDQALAALSPIIDQDFVNLDLQTRDVLVVHDEENGSYKVFYIDFAQCRFRDASDSKEVWRERKRQMDEEGAIGYMLQQYISYAKGKKGKRYKGSEPLPWTYQPSEIYKGECIELYDQAS